MKLIQHTKTIKNVWTATQIILKKQIAILESNGNLSSVFEGLELKEIQLLDIVEKVKLLGDLKNLLKFSLTRTMAFSLNKAAT